MFTFYSWASLEKIFEQDLDQIIEEQVLNPWGMKETMFGPVESAVPTVRGVEAGGIHDPKARLLGKTCWKCWFIFNC